MWRRICFIQKFDLNGNLEHNITETHILFIRCKKLEELIWEPEVVIFAYCRVLVYDLNISLQKMDVGCVLIWRLCKLAK